MPPAAASQRTEVPCCTRSSTSPRAIRDQPGGSGRRARASGACQAAGVRFRGRRGGFLPLDAASRHSASKRRRRSASRRAMSSKKGSPPACSARQSSVRLPEQAAARTDWRRRLTVAPT